MERSEVGVDDRSAGDGRVSSSLEGPDMSATSGTAGEVVRAGTAIAPGLDERGGGEDLSGDEADRAVILLVACNPFAANLRGSDIALGGGRSTVLEVEGSPLAACLSLAISRFNASSSAAASSSSPSSPAPSPPKEVIHPFADVENRLSSALDGDSVGIDLSVTFAGSEEAKRAANEGASESG